MSSFGGTGPVCPRNWKRRWPTLHRAAGLAPRVPDVLRHSFATYHAAHYRNFEQLQYEMGHRSLQLLRYRCLATGDINPEQAANFRNPDWWEQALGLSAPNPAAAQAAGFGDDGDFPLCPQGMGNALLKALTSARRAS